MSGQDLLMSSGKAPEALDFGKTPGVRRIGTVVAGPTEYQPREFDRSNPGKGPLKFYEDGNPVKAIYIDLQTDYRDSATDTGLRRLYVEKRRLREAIRDAIFAVKGTELELGARLVIDWTGYEQGDGGQPAHTYAVQYLPPGQGALMTEPPAAVAQVPQYVPPATQYAPTPAQAPVAAQYTAQPQYAAPAPAQAPVAPVPAPAPAPALQPVPVAVYAAMLNAGVDVSGFTPLG